MKTFTCRNNSLKVIDKFKVYCATQVIYTHINFNITFDGLDYNVVASDPTQQANFQTDFQNALNTVGINGAIDQLVLSSGSVVANVWLKYNEVSDDQLQLISSLTKDNFTGGVFTGLTSITLSNVQKYKNRSITNSDTPETNNNDSTVNAITKGISLGQTMSSISSSATNIFASDMNINNPFNRSGNNSGEAWSLGVVFKWNGDEGCIFSVNNNSLNLHGVYLHINNDGSLTFRHGRYYSDGPTHTFTTTNTSDYVQLDQTFCLFVSFNGGSTYGSHPENFQFKKVDITTGTVTDIPMTLVYQTQVTRMMIPSHINGNINFGTVQISTTDYTDSLEYSLFQFSAHNAVIANENISQFVIDPNTWKSSLTTTSIDMTRVWLMGDYSQDTVQTNYMTGASGGADRIACVENTIDENNQYSLKVTAGDNLSYDFIDF